MFFIKNNSIMQCGDIMEKTMVMKILEKKKLKYILYYYDPIKVDACFVAEVLK